MDGNIKEIYSHIGDDESRRVFSDRLLYSLTDDFQYISDMVKHTKAAQNIRQNILQREQPVKIIFGAGKFGKWFHQSFPDLGWTCFVDNHAYGNTLCGLPVISFDELCSKHKDAFIYVATTLYHKEIERQLMDNDFPRENLLFWDEAMQENKQAQYFDLPFLLLDKEEVFIDMGAYDGLTSLAFTGWSRGQYSKIYAFEPNKKAYDLCKRQCEAIPRCEFISKGVWSKTGDLKFIIDEGNHQASHISEDSGGARLFR